jgi:8-oxo-dGTP diphosphatase
VNPNWDTQFNFSLTGTEIMPAWAIIENDGVILMIRRSANTSRPGQWCFPGGGIKPEEDPEKACIREAIEETNLNIEVVRSIITIDDHHYFRCQLSSDHQYIELKLNECDNFLWVNPNKLLEIGVVMNLKNVYRVLESIGYKIELNDEARNILS